MSFPNFSSITGAVRRAFSLETGSQEAPSTGTTTAPAGLLGELLPRSARARTQSDPLDGTAAALVDLDHRRTLRLRSRVDAVLARLLNGEGIPPYRENDPTGPHNCYRYEKGVLTIRPHHCFAWSTGIGFELHLHGTGLVAKRDGTWVETPDDDFVSELEAAARGSAFRL